MTFLRYFPDTVDPGHRGDDAIDGYGTPPAPARHSAMGGWAK
ncbi:hypothetical protein [Actinoplanes siamensis]|nr:hypothetical protein [Actinoplanes siamensis]